MATLPPYSTYRTDNKQMMYPQAISHGNILTFTPPGFNQVLNVKFPDSRLAVCERCKKNYKTRDMCRVRNAHTTAPWTTAYVCFTLDDTCTDDNGKYVDKPLTVRMVQWQPFCVKKSFDPQTPVCSSCKKTNRTRSFCRERHKHRQLPWCTVYVLLSALDSTDPTTVVADPSKPLKEEDKEGDEEAAESKEEGEEEKTEVEEEKTEEKDKEATEEAAPSKPPPEEKEEPAAEETKADASAEEGESADAPAKEKEESDPVGMIDSDFVETDDVNDIAESRTFLAKVSCKGMSIHWLELAEFDPSENAMNMGYITPDVRQQGGAPVDPQQYFSHAMGYAAQHQNALKSHQQYFFQMQQRHQQQYAAQQAAWQAQYSQQAPGGDPPGDQAPDDSPAPVTAGEAAAQQQKQNLSAEGEQSSGQAPASWQPMMYPQGMYQMPPGGQAESGEVGENGGMDDMEPAPVHAMPDDDDLPDSKRVRMV